MSAKTIDYYIYRIGLGSSNNFSLATASGIIKSLIGLFLVVATNIISKKLTDGGGNLVKIKRIRKKAADLSFDLISTIIMIFVLLVTLYPFWYVLVGSFSSVGHLIKGGFVLWPDGIHLMPTRRCSATI